MTRQMAWGLLLLVVGSLLLVANLGLIPPFHIWDLWPLLFIWPAAKFLFGGSVVFAHAFVDGRRHPLRLRPSSGLGFRFIALWVLAGATAELLHNLSLFPYDWGHVSSWTLPLLLVGCGLAIMFRPLRGTWKWSHRDALLRDGSRASGVVGDLRFGSRPWVFKSPMTINLWAGDVDVDLTTAEFAPGDNYLGVRVWAGEVTMRVPDDMEVAVEARCSAGDLRVFDERRDGLSPELAITRPALRPAVVTARQTNGQPRRLLIGIEMTFGSVRVR